MIELGILKNFDSGTYKAGVQLVGSLTTYFDDISVAKNIPSSALVTGNYVILAIPGGNPRDACVIAAWPQGMPPGSLWTPKIYTTQLPWTALDFLTTSIPTGGSITIGGWAVLFKTGTTADNNCLARTTFGFNAPFPSGKEVTIEFPLSYRYPATSPAHRIVMFFINSTTLPPPENARHVGCIIDNDSIYSSSANGTSQETQDTGVDLPAGVSGFLYQCKAVVNPGVSVKFYINNVLKTTHTMYVPLLDASYAVLALGVKTTSTTEQQAAWERIIVTKEL